MMSRRRDRSPDAVDSGLFCGTSRSSGSTKSRGAQESLFRLSFRRKNKEKHKEESRSSQRDEYLIRSRKEKTCQRCEKQTQEHTQKISALEKAYDEQLRFALTQKENGLRQSRERMMLVNELTRQNHELQSEIERLQRRSWKSRCQRCELQAQEYKQTISEMERFYKAKLTEARSALKETEEQFRSFKDRVSENVVLSLKTENTENMNSPVNQTRLTEMYQQLRVCTWPNIHFTSSDREARKLVQDMFAKASERMETLLVSMSEVKAFSPEVEKFRQTAVENLQLALYHSSKQDVFQAAFPDFDKGSSEFQLASECFWLGCLMALHSPPLHPKWDRTDEKSWTVFPRKLRLQRHSHL